MSVDVSMSQPDIGRTNRELSQGVPRRRRFFDVGEQTANSKRANFNLTFNFIYIYIKQRLVDVTPKRETRGKLILARVIYIT